MSDTVQKFGKIHYIEPNDIVEDVLYKVETLKDIVKAVDIAFESKEKKFLFEREKLFKEALRNNNLLPLLSFLLQSDFCQYSKPLLRVVFS